MDAPCLPQPGAERTARFWRAGSHARWLLSPENHVSIRKAIQPGGVRPSAGSNWLDEQMRPRTSPPPPPPYPICHSRVRAACRRKVLTRAVLDAWDVTKSGVLSIAEIEKGIGAMLSPDVEHPPSCAVIAVAKKIVRELPADATVTVAELETLAAAEVDDIAKSVVRQNSADLISRVYDEQQDFYDVRM